MACRDLLAIGTSAGGFEALRFLARQLPPDLPASVLVTIHLSSQFRSELDAIITRTGPLPARFATDGEALVTGCIYLAPPERHLMVDGKRIWLGIGPRENNARPAIDPMFRSIAACCAHRAIGVILTGTLGDGASGLVALKSCGAITVVQDPHDAAFAGMPSSALQQVTPDHIARLHELPKLLQTLVKSPAGEPVPVSERIKYEVEIARSGRSSMQTMDRIGRRSVLTCPDCNGVMWEIDEGDLTRFRCHVGHTYTAELMSLALDENLRRALASAQRGLEERVALAQRLHRHAKERNHHLLAENWAKKVQEFGREMEVIRVSLERVDQIAAQIVGDREPLASSDLRSKTKVSGSV